MQNENLIEETKVISTLRRSVLHSFDEAETDTDKLEVAARTYRLGLTDLAYMMCYTLCLESELDNHFIMQKIYRQ